MIVKKLVDVENTEHEISTPNWVSRRLLLQRDGMGFSMHDTIIRAGTSTRMQYLNHLEAVYCIEGQGTITLVETGATYPISAGTLYALDQNDHHILEAITQMRMVCVFNPPLTGQEVHDERGAYPLLTSTPTELQAKPA